MTVFIFTPSAELLGKFDIESLDQIADKLADFAASSPVTPYHYLECAGKTWTVMAGQDGLELEEGRLSPDAPNGQSSFASSPDEKLVPGQAAEWLKKRYEKAYAVAKVMVRFGLGLRVIGILVFVFGVFITVDYFDSKNQRDGVITLFASALVGLLFDVLGMLFRCLAQLLRAALDQAVFSCPVLTDEQRIRIAGAF